MAYDKYTWQTGEIITQEKLNHMEDGIEDAYELPAVTETDNGKVLGVEDGAWSLVNGGGDAGYECIEEVEELFNETVTTVATESGSTATLAYNEGIFAQTLRVIFDGEQYDVEGREGEDVRVYANPPHFIIISNLESGVNTLNTPDAAGEHSIQAFELYTEVDSVSPCFSAAVEEVATPIIDELLERRELKTIYWSSVQGNLNLAANGTTQLIIDIPSNHKVVGIVGIEPISIQLDKTSYAYLIDVYANGGRVRLTYGNPTSQTFTRSVYVNYSYVLGEGAE